MGLLGGSFNPAHGGHRNISLLALKRLQLDEVWWLVSPQNPLKARAGMEPLEQRVSAAQSIARHPRIRVTAIEQRLGTSYTADSLKRLSRCYPDTSFVWLMGADNLIQIPQWRHWKDVFAQVPVAVFDRPTYSYRALAGEASHRFAHARLGETKASALAGRTPPAWIFFWGAHDPSSATALRERNGGG